MITIIDYGMGNLGSIQNMLKKVGFKSLITSSPTEIEQAEKLILPGVGSFDQAMLNLKQLDLIEVIKRRANEGVPLFGICLGMQLLADCSEEGELAGLGLIPGKVKRFDLPAELKIPHMGWNLVDYNSKSPLFAKFDSLNEVRFYFVHSYFYVCNDSNHVIGTTNYGSPFTSSVQRRNIYGAQFHPEKSHKFGMLMLENFAKM